MLLQWKFRYYAADGVGSVRGTYESGTVQLKARFLSRLRILAQLPAREWHSDYVKSLSGPCHGLMEIRFKANGVQQRPLGFRSDNGEFTILFWATERGGKFVPRSACETALARKAAVFSGEEETYELWIKLE